MIRVKEDGYILGKFINKDIKNIEDEINLKIEPKTNINYSPLFYDFTIQDIEEINRFFTREGILKNGVKIVNNEGYVGNIGGINRGTVTLGINAPTSGEYKLSFQYLSGNETTMLKVKVNNIDNEMSYYFNKTNSWLSSDFRTFNIKVKLNGGSNCIKFFNDLSKHGPQLNKLILSKINYRKVYSSKAVILGGYAKVKNDFMINVCKNFGYIILNIDVPKDKYYEILIRYINLNKLEKYSNISINKMDMGDIYNFPKTNLKKVNTLLYRRLILFLKSGINAIKIYNK